MKNAHDLVAAAKARVPEVSVADAEQVIREASVLVWKTSGRAALAGAALQDMGYLNVQNMAGGFDAWVAAGKPVAKPEAPSFEWAGSGEAR
jgi:rhodanese-related sulfurtransferase